MNPLIANDMVRFTVNGNYAGRLIANVFDMALVQDGTPTQRATAIAAQAGVIVSAWADEICELLVDDYTATSVSWLDLSSLNGSVGQTSIGPGTDFPKAGEDITNPMPGSVAYRVLKNTTPQRGQRQGRMYLVGVPENATTTTAPNNVSSATVTAWNTKLAAFLSAINVGTSQVPPAYEARLGVIHTHVDKVDPDDPSTWVLVYEGSSLVNSLTMGSLLGTQRRRLSG